MMRIRFGLILKITVRTKSYISLKNAILQNHQNHKRNYHSFQGPTPIISQAIFQLSQSENWHFTLYLWTCGDFHARKNG